MEFVFEHVRKEEADEVLDLYRSLIGTPFCAWTADYPSRSDVDFDLSRNALFCLRNEENGEIAGVISIDEDPKAGTFQARCARKLPEPGNCQKADGGGDRGTAQPGIQKCTHPGGKGK